MNLIDKARIELAVQRFSYHLESLGTPGERRRELRSELRANLLDAAAASGAQAALDGIGSPRALAVEVGELDRSRPRWWVGATWGMLTLLVIVTGLFWTGYVVVATLEAAGGGSAVLDLIPWLGVRFSIEIGADGSPGPVGAQGSVLWLLLPVAVMLLTAQPWRPWTHRSQRHAVVAQP